jgi:hypothetical protein
LKVSDENRRIRIQDPDPNPDPNPDQNPDPDPLVRDMDPRIRIRIRIHPKMSWIRNTGMKWLRTLKSFQIFKIEIKKSKTYSG